MNGPEARGVPCRRSLGLALAALVGAGACAPSEPATGTRARPIIGGTRDTGDPAVVLLVIKNTALTKEYDCSTFVVSPHVVVTAAHCVSPYALGSDDFTFNLFLGDNYRDTTQRNDPTKWVATQSVTPHPSFDYNGAPPPYDVGVVVAAASLGVTPLPMNRGALQAGWVGQTVRPIGYGETIAGQVANAIENANLFEETQRRAHQLATAAEVSQVATAMLDTQALIARVSELIRERFNLYFVALYLLVHWRYKVASLSVFIFPLVFVMALVATLGNPVSAWSSPVVRNAWLTATGHKRPGVSAGLPLPEAQAKARATSC